MEHIIFTPDERNKIAEYFGKKPEEITLEELELKHRELRARYHPDKFEKYSDDIVKELARAKFTEIESLAEKIKKKLLADKKNGSIDNELFGLNPQFAFNKLKIEIITKEKDLKYYLFGTQYRWLEKGDKYTIKGTKATIIIDANYSGRTIGFTEGIKMYLTFTESDSLEEIFAWLFFNIVGYATSIIIGGKSVKIDYYEMLLAVKQKTFLKLGSGEA